MSRRGGRRDELAAVGALAVGFACSGVLAVCFVVGLCYVAVKWLSL